MVAALIAFLLLVLAAGYLYTRFIDKRLHQAYPAKGRFTNVTGGIIHWFRSDKSRSDKSGSDDKSSESREHDRYPPLILIHGLAGNMHNFVDLEVALRKSYTVYCVDRPGSGHAHRLNDTDASFDEQSRMLVEWMEKESIPPAIIVGHSMGGGIALNLALQFPQWVAGLVLISPLAAPIEIRASALTKWALKRAWFRLFAAKVLVTAFRRRFSRQQMNAIFAPEPTLPTFASEYGGDLSMHSTAFFAASADLASAQRSLYSQYQHYHAIKRPVGVIYGDGDRVLSCRQQMGHLQKELPEADYVQLKGRGHMLPITAVDDCVALIHSIADKTAGPG